MNETWNKALVALKSARKPLLISHPRPDGDTIGSTLALYLAMQELGSRPIIACSHPLPLTLSYLPGAEDYVSDVPENIDCDLVVAIDMSDLKRTGGIFKDSWTDKTLLVIDHHQTNDSFGDLNIVRPELPATAILMHEVIEALDVDIKGDIATCLLVGIITDTRGLRTSGTSPDVLRLVSKLIEAGGDYHTIMQKTMDAIPYRKMQAWGTALQRIQLKGSVAWTTYPLEAKDALGIEDHYDLDLGNLLSRTAEANVIATFLEMRDGTTKVSMRSRPGYDVAHIAKDLGGGGHAQAAGCSVEGDIDSVVALVLPYLFEETKHDA